MFTCKKNEKMKDFFLKMDFELGVIKINERYISLKEKSYGRIVFCKSDSMSQSNVLMYTRFTNRGLQIFNVATNNLFTIKTGNDDVSFFIDETNQIVPSIKGMIIDNKFGFRKISGEERLVSRKTGHKLIWCRNIQLSYYNLKDIVSFKGKCYINEIFSEVDSFLPGIWYNKRKYHIMGSHWKNFISESVTLESIISMNSNVSIINMNNLSSFIKILRFNPSDLVIDVNNFWKLNIEVIINVIYYYLINFQQQEDCKCYNEAIRIIGDEIVHAVDNTDIFLDYIFTIKKMFVQFLYKQYIQINPLYAFILSPLNFYNYDIQTTDFKSLNFLSFNVLMFLIAESDGFSKIEFVCTQILFLINNGLAQNKKRFILEYEYIFGDLDNNFFEERKVVTFEQCILYFSTRGNHKAQFFARIRKRMVELDFDIYSDEHFYYHFSKIINLLDKQQEKYEICAFDEDKNIYYNILHLSFVKNLLYTTNFKEENFEMLLSKHLYADDPFIFDSDLTAKKLCDLENKYIPSFKFRDLQYFNKNHIKKLFSEDLLKINADMIYFRLKSLPCVLIDVIFSYVFI